MNVKRWRIVETPDTEPTFTVRMAHAGGARIWRENGAETAILVVPGDPAVELPWIGVLDWLDSRVVDPDYKRMYREEDWEIRLVAGIAVQLELSVESE